MTINLGDIFEVDTSKGKAYIHYIFKDDSLGYLIRVLPGLYLERPVRLDELVDLNEMYMVFFPLSAAYKRKIIKKIGNYPFDKYDKPKYMRTEHIVKGEFLGWHIIDTNTWERRLIKVLTPEQQGLSPWGIWNDTLLIEKIYSNWNLEKWI